MEQGGGFEQYCIATVVRLQQLHSDYEISIVTASDEMTERLQTLLTAITFQRLSRKGIYREDSDKILKQLGEVKYIKCDSLKMMKSVLAKQDVIYTKNEVLELFILSFFGLKKLPSVVAAVHTPILYPVAPSYSEKLHNLIYGGPIYRTLLKRVRAVKVQNDNDYYIAKHKFKLNDVYLIRHPFDLGLKAREQPIDPFLRILFAGRITEQKGVDVLIQILDKLAAWPKFDRLSIKIAGSGNDRLVRQLADRASRHQNIMYLGHVPSENMQTLYEWADIGLVTSRYETLSQVAVKVGLANGIVISNDIPGPQDVVIHDKTGYLVPLAAEIFVEKIEQLFELKETNPSQFTTIGKAARQHLISKYDPEITYNEFERMFNEVV